MYRITQARRWSAALLSALLLTSCAGVVVQQDPLTAANTAMGGTAMRTLRFTAAGDGATFGQAYQPGMAWPQLKYASFSRIYDYEQGAMREDYARSRAEPTGGGAVPLMGAGEQRATGLSHGAYAWNLSGATAVPAPVAADSRIHDLWTSPHGLVKAAIRNKAEVRNESGKWVVSFTEPGRFSAVAWIGADGLLERVDSMQPNAVLGDMPTVTFYSEWRDWGGVKFPAVIRQNQGGFEVLDLRVSGVEVNLPSNIELPPAVPAFVERVAVERAADGVWLLAGGSHNSVLIEMRDHSILVEAPLYDGRSLAVLAEAQRLAPGKPVRYVINSHHHFDHSGGLRAAVAAGATLVVSERARSWFERVLANSNRISPDAMARSGRLATVQAINTQHTFSDSARSVDVFMIQDSIHAQGFMMVWLPRERLLIQADAFTPPPAGAPVPMVANANHVNLLDNIEALKLNVERIVPLHGRIVPIAELYRATGRRP